MDRATLSALEFDQLKSLLLPYAQSELGKKKIQETAPWNDLERVRLELAKTTEGVRWTSEQGKLPLEDSRDPALLLERLGIDGSCLEPLEIYQLLQLAQVADEVRKRLRREVAFFPLLGSLAEALPEFKGILAAIRGKLLATGVIEDFASPDLKEIRVEIQRMQARLKVELESFLKREDTDKVLQDLYVTIRNGRFVLPIKSEHQRTIPGVIHAASSTGHTVFLEPLVTIDLNNELVRLREMEREEVARILQCWTEMFRAVRRELTAAGELVAELDALFARAALSRTFQCNEPRMNEEAIIELEGARHPLLEAALRPLGRPVVPMNVTMGRETQVLILSGPNAGGKTVALKTIGLLTLMAQTGLHVPAQRAELAVFPQVLADIGDHQSIAANLSTFSSHILRIAHMTSAFRNRALVLLDEVGTGTDPSHGVALGISLIDYFRRRGAWVVATTHHGGLKSYGFSTPGVLNAAMEFDEVSLAPTFRLIPGVAGSSSGIEIASRLGLDREIIQEARRLLDPREQEEERYLSQIKSIREEAASLRDVLQVQMEAVERRRAKLEADYRRKEEELDRKNARELENLARRFQEETETFLKSLRDKALAAEQRREAGRKARYLKQKLAGEFGQREQALSGEDLREGDTVEIRDLALRGRVEKVRDDGAVQVRVGNKRVEVSVSQLKRCEPAPVPKETRLPASVSLHLAEEEAPHELNLLGCTVQEGLERLDKFLDRAFVGHLDQVRIVHGHGTGRLRSAVREFLSQHPQVDRHYPAPPAQGGTGATIAELRL
ncbi:MAG: endonuclease MutS2 [Acidobacteria bacterium]|nr:endonuclease MutS2 [Acidobacteriota bacterium]